MMMVHLPYGESEIEVDVPDANYAGTIEPGGGDVIGDVTSHIAQAVADDGIVEFLSGSSTVLVIANDSFRSTPSRHALSALSRYLRRIRDVRIIIATGLHPKPTRDEIRFILGDDFAVPDENVFHSDAYDLSQFDPIGEWGSGAEILVHKLVGWAERIIVIGSVEPHYFAGFTGGPKSFMPGLAHHTSIEANHSLAIDLASQAGKLDHNPVAESIKEAAAKLDCSKVYSIQFVNNSRGEVVGVFTGGLWSSFGEAVSCARGVYMRPVPGKCAVVVAASRHPLDRNLYQLQKSFENSRPVVLDGGSIIVISACAEGIGNDEFFRLAGEYPSPERILAARPEGCSLGFHKLYRTALHRQSVDIFVKSELDDAAVRRVYLEPVDDVQMKVNQEIDKYNGNMGVLFIKDAGHMVPYVDRAA